MWRKISYNKRDNGAILANGVGPDATYAMLTQKMMLKVFPVRFEFKMELDLN